MGELLSPHLTQKLQDVKQLKVVLLLFGSGDSRDHEFPPRSCGPSYPEVLCGTTGFLTNHLEISVLVLKDMPTQWTDGNC